MMIFIANGRWPLYRPLEQDACDSYHTVADMGADIS